MSNKGGTIYWDKISKPLPSYNIIYKSSIDDSELEVW